MLKDFYYSKKMQETTDWLDMLDGHGVRRHSVNINGAKKVFTVQTKHENPHNCGWEDIEFLGTADDSLINYDFNVRY